MHILDAAQMRGWDEFTITNEPITSIDLMERAAAACLHWLKQNHFFQRSFSVFCGPGNNGGDGLALARMLHQENRDVSVWVLSSGNGYSPDCHLNLQRLTDTGLRVDFITETENIPIIPEDTVVIDVLYGSGFNKPLSDVAAVLVAVMNSTRRQIVSIDLPSGLFADKPSAPNISVQAEHTLTFQAYKPALLMPENAYSFGEVHVLDIGLHPAYLQTIQKKFEWINHMLIRSFYNGRNQFTHKGDHGHAALITGSIGLMGAATLCAAGCMRSGVGKLTCYIPRVGYEIMQTAVPEAMAAVSGDDHIDRYDPVFSHEAVGVGPGIGYKLSAALFKKILKHASAPMLLDADALTLLSKNPKLLGRIPAGSVITPHPKEFDRMFGKQASDFERIDTAIAKAKEFNLVIVLKGHHTLVALPDGKAFFNSTGNAGMATGGSGDVLAGIITGLLAQGYLAREAAILGVYLHGLAGDLAAKELSREGMIAGDIVKYLPKAFLFLTKGFFPRIPW